MAEKWWESDPIAKAPQGDQWWAKDPIAGKEKERTIGEALSDIYAGGKYGVGAVLQYPSQALGLVTGQIEKPGEETGLAAAGAEMQKEAEAMMSPGLKAREAARAGKIAEAEKRGQMDAFFTAFSETVRDPGLLLNFFAENVPQLIPGLGAARLIKPLAGTTAAIRGAIGVGATQQATDVGIGTYREVYDELVKRGVSETEAAGQALGLARASGAGAFAISLIAQNLPGARAIEEAFAGKEGQLGRLLGGLRGAAGEAVSEVAEETPAKALQNLLLQQVAPETPLTRGLGEVAAMAGIGGAGLGGVSGLLQRQARREEAPPEVPPETAPPSQFTPTPEPEGPAGAPTAEELQKINKKLGKEPLTQIEYDRLLQIGYTPEQIDEFQARAEAPPEGEYVSGEPQPEPPEIADIEKERTDFQKQVDALKKGQPGESLWSKVKGKLVPSELSELGEPKRLFGLRAAKGTRGYTIADLVADGTLDPWLPPQYRKGSVEAEMQMDPQAALDRDLKAEEHIKEMFRAGNYLTFDTQQEIKQLGKKLSDLEDAYQEHIDAKTFNDLVQEAIDEQGRIYQDAEAALTEAEVGAVEPPARVYETIPEEPIEEEDEYYPDKYLSVEPRKDEEKRPSFRREAARIIKKFNEDRMSPQMAMMSMDRAFRESKVEPEIKPLRRGATWIRRKLLEALDQGVLSQEAVDFAEWMIKQNPAILDDLAVAIRTPKEGVEAAGGYNPFGKMMYLFKGQAGSKTAVHEILHHMERMMPENIQDEIRRLWIKSFMQANKKAQRGDDANLKKFFDILSNYHFGGGAQSEMQFRSALKMIADKLVAPENYQYANPSEFWAVNATDIMSKRFEAKEGVINRLRNWLREFAQKLKDAFGFTSEAPILRALDSLIKGDGKFKSQSMLGVAVGYESIPEEFAKAKKAVKAALQPRKLPKSQFEHVPQEFYEKLEPIFAPEKKTIVEKIEGMQDKFWQKLAQGIADQYRSIRDVDEIAYIKARMSKTIDGALEGILFNGEVKLTDGALDIAPNTKGLMQILEPVGNEVDSYQIWVALNREAEIYEKSVRAYDKIDNLKGQIKDLGIQRRTAKTVKEANKISDEIEQKKKEVNALRSSIKGISIKPEIVEQRDLLSSGTLNGRPRIEVYREVQKAMNKLNRSVLNVALQQGTINKEAYEIYANDINYIPFYKVMEETGDVQAAATKSGLVNQYFSKALKGGEKPFGDLMENTLRNWSHILSSSMKNEAANATLRAAVNMNGATPNLKSGLVWKVNEDGEGMVYMKKTGALVGKLKPEYTTSEGKGLVKTMIDGKPAYFSVTNPLLLESIMSIGYMGPKSKFLDVARDFKNMLQFGVTLSPAFKVRNLVRDSVQSAAVSGLGLNLAKNVKQGLDATKKDNPDYISALAGGAIFNFGSYMEGDQAKSVKRLIKAGVSPDNILNTEQKIAAGLAKAYKAYQEWGNRSEAANRMALYKQLRAKGYSHLKASYHARDLLDFSMQGSWPAFRLATQVVPFLNARVQGLYKLGRDGVIPTSRVIYNSVTGKPIDLDDKQKAQQFSVVTGAVMMASLMLYMAFKDDDEFKKREQWDRDNFWWFKMPGMEAALRIPKPFEIGAFGTFAERIAEQMMDSGAEGRVFEQSMKRMLTDTFAVNLPQVFKPLVDLYANKDSFTGAPIETAGMERLSKAERVATNTSPLAKALSAVSNVFLPEATEVSPVQVDYAIKAYFGWMGATISGMSHYAVMPFSKGAYPDHNWTDTITLGFVKSLPATQSGYVTSFYENMKIIEQSYADMRHYAELGQSDKVQEILEEKGDKIAMAKFYDKTSKDMSKIRQAMRVIQEDETMSGAQKREEIDRLKLLIGELAKQAEEIRKSMRK